MVLAVLVEKRFLAILKNKYFVSYGTYIFDRDDDLPGNAWCTVIMVVLRRGKILYATRGYASDRRAQASIR
jgi:hypothetical protein